MQAKIFSIPLSQITAEVAAINQAFVQDILKQIPQAGKEAESHFIVNTNLTVHDGQNSKEIQSFNVLLQRCRANGGHHLLMLTKN